MSLRAKIFGLVATWFFSLLLSLIGSAVKRAIVRQQQAAPAHKPAFKNYSAVQGAAKPANDAAFRNWTVTDTIYQGMKQSELVAAYGEPARKSRDASNRETWVYTASRQSNDNAVLPAMTVTLDRGIVTDWLESGAA